MIFYDLVYFTLFSQVLRTWGQRALAGGINDTGRKLLTVDVAAITQQTALPPKGAQTEHVQNESSSNPERGHGSARGELMECVICEVSKI